MKIVCLGDSLTWGLGVQTPNKWTYLWNEESKNFIQGRGINGDTTGGMLARFDRDVLKEKPEKVVIMGGSNDLIMGCDIAIVKANVMAMVHHARAMAIQPVLASSIPTVPNMTPAEYQVLTDFSSVNGKLLTLSRWYEVFAKSFNIQYINTFEQFSEAVIDAPEEFYVDGLHPNQRGHRLLADIFIKDCG